MSEPLFIRIMVRLFGWHPRYGFLIDWEKVERDMHRNRQKFERP